MKVILTETQLKTLIEQQTSNLTVPEQTLLGFLNRFLRGEKGEFENTPDGQLKKTMMFNSKTIYPIVQALLVKKNTGKKTYDDKTFNALFMSMDKAFKEMLDIGFRLHHKQRSVRGGVWSSQVKLLISNKRK